MLSREVLVIWLSVLLSTWNILGSRAEHFNANANGSASGIIIQQQKVPKVRHTYSLPKLDIVVRETSSPSWLRRRGVIDIGNVLYSSLSYNVIILIGNIFFEVALDSGSSDLWIITDQCQTTECKSNPSYPLLTYDSPSFRMVNDNQTVFNISFADTTYASGFVAREVVQVGDIIMPNQTIGLANFTNVTLGPSVSGVFGMGFSRLSQFTNLAPQSTPLIPALVETGVLEYPLFGLSLTRNASGTLSFGAVDKSVVQNVSLMSWHAVEPFEPLPGQNASVTPLYLDWAIPLDDIMVNETSLVLHPSFPKTTGKKPLALLDVGFSGISGPYEDVATIFLQLDTIRQASPGIWAVPCDIKATITFNFGGTNVTLQPSDFLIGPTEGDPNLCLSWPIAQLPPEDDGIDWHLGVAFLRAVYTVYSYGIAGKEPPLVGLYPLHNSTALMSNTSLLSSAFSSLSATIATTLPPVLLPTPSLTLPSYVFNTSITPFPTLEQTSPLQIDDGNNSYTPLFTPAPNGSPGLLLLTNTTALPVIDPPSSISTVITTDPAGETRTLTSTISPIPTRILGLPPGTYSLNGARSLSIPELTQISIFLVVLRSFILYLWT